VQAAGWRRWLLAAAAYVLITIPFVSPLINYDHLHDASYEGDSRLLIWTLAWDSHALLTGTPLFDANMFHPLPRALTRTEHHIGIGIFALPFYALTGNAVLTYWIIWLLAFPLNALAMHALAWRVTRDHAGSFIAGLIYAFCFFRMHHAHGHIQLLWTWALPLVPLALERWIRRPTWNRATVAVALIVVQALSSWYLAVFVGLLALISVVVLFPRRPTSSRDSRGDWRAYVLQGGGCLAVGGIIVAWFAWPYVGLSPGPVEEAAANSADLKAYLVPPENTWVGQWLSRNTSLNPRWIWGEQTIYAGVTTTALALSGVWRLRHRAGDHVAAPVVLTGLLALALSFGPSVTGWSPFDLFARLPAMGLLRAPARFALLVMMAASVLAAIGITPIQARGRKLVFATIMAVAILAESHVVNFPAGKPAPLPIPAAYRRIAALPPGAVLSLPTYRGTPEAFRESDYLLFSTSHWRPIVNGFGRQEPSAHAETMATLAKFPNRESVELMRKLNIRYVIVHPARAREIGTKAAEARASQLAQLIGNLDGDLVFKIPQ
jgi:hypothetical protein